MIATSVRGTRRRSSPCEDVRDRRRRGQHDGRGDAERALGDDVPRRPQPGLGEAAGRARRRAGSRPTIGSSTANSRNGTSMTSRRATPSSGTRPISGGEHDEPGARRRTPRTAPSAWPRRRTRTAPSPAACTAGRAGAAVPPRCTRRCRCAPPTSGRSTGRRRRGGRAAGGRARRAGADDERGGDADEPGEAGRRARVVDAVDAVVGERAAGEARARWPRRRCPCRR